jgi:hypothetical protein
LLRRVPFIVRETCVPSLLHEGVLDLFRKHPELAAEMLSGPLHTDLSKWDEVQPESNEVTRLAPASYWADLVLGYWAGGKPVQAVIVEAQLSEVKEKRRRWPVYVTRVHDELDCPTYLLVVCPNPKVARWAAQPISLGHPDFTLTPLVLGPDLVPVVGEERGAAEPELAVLSAVAHWAGPEREVAFQGLMAGLRRLGRDRAHLYAEVVAAAVESPYALSRLRELFMSLETMEPQSEIFRPHSLRGKAEGEAEAVLTVLDARGIEVPEDARQRVTECTDLDTLRTWIRRAATVASVEEMFD